VWKRGQLARMSTHTNNTPHSDKGALKMSVIACRLQAVRTAVIYWQAVRAVCLESKV